MRPDDRIRSAARWRAVKSALLLPGERKGNGKPPTLFFLESQLLPRFRPERAAGSQRPPPAPRSPREGGDHGVSRVRGHGKPARHARGPVRRSPRRRPRYVPLVTRNLDQGVLARVRRTGTTSSRNGTVRREPSTPGTAGERPGRGTSLVAVPGPPARERFQPTRRRSIMRRTIVVAAVFAILATGSAGAEADRKSVV